MIIITLANPFLSDPSNNQILQSNPTKLCLLEPLYLPLLPTETRRVALLAVRKLDMPDGRHAPWSILFLSLSLGFPLFSISKNKRRYSYALATSATASKPGSILGFEISFTLDVRAV